MEEDPLSICYCGWGYNRPMIRCRYCRHWYHYDCVNVTRKILEDAEHWYCFACIDYKPNSDSEDDYDFIADVKRKREMDRETQNGVKRMLMDNHFSANSILTLPEKEIQRSICCIEQQLLIEDTSYLSHTDSCSVNNSKTELEKKDRLLLLSNHPYLKTFFLDIEKMKLQNSTFSVVEYLSLKESRRRHSLSNYDNRELETTRQLLNQKQILSKSIPINADVRTFNWKQFGSLQKSLTGHYFDVVMMDPPWQLTSDNPSRGVAIKYQQLDDESIGRLPLSMVQENGLLFVWAINSKYATAIQLIAKWGYEFVCDIAWVKLTPRGYIAQGNGFYLRHTKETCFVAKKGNLDRVDKEKLSKLNDTILSKRTGQSQKPNEIYTIIESLVPNGFYLEIFGRRNNLRDNWVTIGNEV